MALFLTVVAALLLGAHGASRYHDADWDMPIHPQDDSDGLAPCFLEDPMHQILAGDESGDWPRRGVGHVRPLAAETARALAGN